MILVDTSVWIDHLHRTEPRLVQELTHDEVGCHAMVIQELALGRLKDRGQVLDLLGALSRFPILRSDELLALVEARKLWGRGLSPVDAHLIGSCLLVPASRLWTRDRSLQSAAAAVGVTVVA